jgi:pimeloyl-ACP methyl ester carboxylesterase
VAFEDALVAATGTSLAALAPERLCGARDAGLLVIHDEQDKDVPVSDGRLLVDLWPGARFQGTTGLGHRRILRDPGVIADIVQACEAGAWHTGSDLDHALPQGWQFQV